MAAPILLCDTAGMSNDRWLECRMHGPKGDIPYTVGGSDVAAIFGVSPWTTPLELWMIKKGRMKPKPKDNADQLEMGHLLEPIAAHWYGKKSGNYVYEDMPKEEQKTFAAVFLTSTDMKDYYNFSYKDMCEITDGIGNTEETDDGFLDALNGTAEEDWSDESDIPV